jgi:hypothetical protein
VGLATGQAVVPAAQLSTHLLAAQSWPGLQVVPQAPQFDGSVVSLVQKFGVAAGQALGVEAGQLQALVTHCWPVGQVLPQVPQLLASSVRFAQ